MKTLDVEELLNWAFVHELPKGGGVDGLADMNSAWRMLQASSWGKVTAWAELMATVDLGARDHSNFMFDQGEPHEDAVEIGRAVADLAFAEIVVPAGWRPLCDWPEDDCRLPGLREAAVGEAVDRFMLRTAARRGAHLVSLVAGTAILGREPAWDAPVPAIRMVERGGKAAWFVRQSRHDPLSGKKFDVEVQGYDGRTHRPKPGAYRKYQFSDDPVGDILGRLDRELWAAALRSIEATVANQLVDHRLRRWEGEAAPWGEAGPRIAVLARQGARSKMTA